MKIYIFKYALTKGIIEVEANVDENGYASYKENGSLFSAGRQGVSWATSLDEAVSMSEAMRNKKIRSLQKQILKLETKQLKVVSK